MSSVYQLLGELDAIGETSRVSRCTSQNVAACTHGVRASQQSVPLIRSLIRSVRVSDDDFRDSPLASFEFHSSRIEQSELSDYTFLVPRVSSIERRAGQQYCPL